ncbi:MAG TPA: hypothetical protein VLC92_18780 [Rhodocyclaceae bacterium]|nr:hypothetical protein [Rhodocyclaceae bacterium]
MNKITQSGLCYEESGQLMLVTQGLFGYTLVAHKKILFRLYMDLSATRCVTVLATVTYKVFGFSIKKSFVIPTESLLIESGGLLGDSVGILFSGDVFPFFAPVISSVAFDVFGNPSSVPHFSIPELVFLMPGRLRLMIHNLTGTAPWGTQIESNFSWLVDMFQSLERLSAMMPVRDGVKLGLRHTDAGLCYVFGENLDPWPAVCPSGSAPPCTQSEMVEFDLRETKEINAGGTADRIDATVVWRPRDLFFPAPGGEGVGGKAINYNSPPGTGLAALVGGNLNGKEFTGAILAQEIGHLFGLEPKDSPHFEDPLDGLHSKDPAHNDPFAFDFYLLKTYQPPAFGFLGDVMNNFGGGVGQGRDMVLYNAFDWEHLRQQFVKLPGVARSATGAKRSPKESQKAMTATLDASFANAAAIKVDNPGKALPTRKGYAWHWTERGFQPAAKGASSKSRSALAPSVEGIRSWLRDRGVTEFYAPVGARPLPMVINPNAHTTLDREGFSERNGI